MMSSVGDSPRSVGVSRSAQSVAATSPSGLRQSIVPFRDVSSCSTVTPRRPRDDRQRFVRFAEGEPDDSTMVDLPAITAAMAEAHAAAQSGREHDATEPDLAGTEADLDNAPQAQMTGIGDEATPSGS